MTDPAVTAYLNGNPQTRAAQSLGTVLRGEFTIMLGCIHVIREAESVTDEMLDILQDSVKRALAAVPPIEEGEIMKYRALLVEPGNTPERPKQMLTNDWREIVKWTEEALLKSCDPCAFVQQFETIERKTGTVQKMKESPK